MKAYAKTEVSVSKTQEAIRNLLLKGGAKGIQITEEFEEGLVALRFILDIKLESKPLRVTALLKISRGEDPGEERQNFRALYWYLKSQLEAIEFGIVKVEDVFLSYFEMQLPEGRTTIGDEMKRRLPEAMGGNIKGLLPGKGGGSD